MQQKQQQRGSLLPVPAQQAGKQGFHDQETRAHRAGEGLQDDHFNAGVGLWLKRAGKTGVGIEVVTSTIALFVKFLQNPAGSTLDPTLRIVICLGLSFFFAFVVELGMFLLVVNLHDPFQNLFSKHPLQAFVTNGEVQVQLVIRWVFIAGCVGLNIWWNISFFYDLTSSDLLADLGCFILLFCSLLLWPLGIKLDRMYSARIQYARMKAQQMYNAEEARRASTAYTIRTDTVVDANQPGQRGIAPR